MQVVPADTAPSALVGKILRVLAAYDASAVETTWQRTLPAAQRPEPNLAGPINGAPSMAATAVFARHLSARARV
jgi:hypothetical protein